MKAREVVMWRWYVWRWAPFAAWAVVVAAMVVGFVGTEQNDAEIEATQVAIVEGQREGCERQNRVRRAIRANLRAERRQLQMTDPDLFPDIPLARWRQLVRERAEGYRQQIRRVRPVDCMAVYPLPR